MEGFVVMAVKKTLEEVLGGKMKPTYIKLREGMEKDVSYKVMFSSEHIPNLVAYPVTVPSAIANCVKFYNRHNIKKVDVPSSKCVNNLFYKEREECNPEDFVSFHTFIGYDGKTFYHYKSFGEDEGSTYALLSETEYKGVKTLKTSTVFGEDDMIGILEKGSSDVYMDGLRTVLTNKQLLVVFCSALIGLINEFRYDVDTNFVINIADTSVRGMTAIENLTLSVFGNPDSLHGCSEKNQIIDRKYIPAFLGNFEYSSKKFKQYLAFVIDNNDYTIDLVKSPIFIRGKSEFEKQDGYYNKVLTVSPYLDSSICKFIENFTEENQGVFVNDIAEYFIDNKLFGRALSHEIDRETDRFIRHYSDKFGISYERCSHNNVLQTCGMIMFCAEVLEKILNFSLNINSLQSELIKLVHKQLHEGCDIERVISAFNDIKTIIAMPNLRVQRVDTAFDPKVMGIMGYKLDGKELSLFISSGTLREIGATSLFDLCKSVLKNADCLRTSGSKFTYQDTKRGRYYYIKVPDKFQGEILTELREKA